MQLSHSPRHHVAKPRPGKLLALSSVTLATITLLSGFSLPTDVRAADPPQTDAAEAAQSAAVTDATSPTPAAEVTANSAAFEITVNSADATVAPDPVRQRQLSVAPSHQAMLPADRPAWVGAAPDVSTTQHRLFVGSFPTAFVEQVDEGSGK